MTERGLPIVDGAPACPFVAFDDDRDERASSPDHRHRCYAESQPAPRALAHQEAYCLSSAFPVCPTFQDWARREAARTRTDRLHDGEGPLGAGASAVTASSQRNPPRSWQSPPPWLASSGRSGESRRVDAWADEGEDANDDEISPVDVPEQARGLSGSYADRVASNPSPDPGAAESPSGPARGNGAGRADAPGRADDPDDLDAEALDDGRAPATGAAAGAAAGAAIVGAGAVAAGASADYSYGAEPPRRRRERDPDRMAGLSGNGAPPPPGGRPPERRREPPEWERARPPESYPTLRSRRLPDFSLPPMLVAVVALLLAAAVLFALPGLLGFGKPQAAASPTPGVPVVTPIPSSNPTSAPAPTGQIYLVRQFDTMSRIAGRFGISLEELLAANQDNIPNADALQIGQEIIIPVPPPSELPAASEIPAAP